MTLSFSTCGKCLHLKCEMVEEHICSHLMMLMVNGDDETTKLKPVYAYYCLGMMEKCAKQKETTQ